MSRFHYRVLVEDQTTNDIGGRTTATIDISGRTTANSDSSDIYRAQRLFGNITVCVSENNEERVIVSYKELKELNDRFTADSHDNEVISETLNAAFGVLIKRRNIEGYDVRLAAAGGITTTVLCAIL